MDVITCQWLERADYDLETAAALLKAKRYLYVAFMCQQCIEKSLKAYIASKGNLPPFVHALPRLAEEAALLPVLSEEFQQLLADLNPYYIKARYGEYKDAISKICTAERASSFLKETERFAQWLKQKVK